MPTYALLGATGATGSAVLRSLLRQSPDKLTLNIFVRSQFKLLKTFPGLEQTQAFHANIIEGTADDQTALQRCLQNADVIFMCIATNDCKPGLTLAVDTVTSIIAALQHLRNNQGPSSYRAPTILQLRSTTLNKKQVAQTPWLVHELLMFCLYYVYSDLDRACKLYEVAAKQTPGLLKYIIVDPPALHNVDVTPTGHELETEKLLSTNLSYADLGGAFCELAQRRKEFNGMAVGVSATGPVKTDWLTLVGYMYAGVKARILG